MGVRVNMEKALEAIVNMDGVYFDESIFLLMFENTWPHISEFFKSENMPVLKKH